MKKGYIQSIASATMFHEIILKMHEKGIASDQIVIDQSFADFEQTLESGDWVVVYSLDCFSTVAELLDTTIKFSKRGIELASLTDSWYHICPDMISTLKGITEFTARIRANNTRVGIAKAKAKGRTFGRPVGSVKLHDKVAEVEKLHRQTNISIAKACAIVDCTPRSYYRLQKQSAQTK